MMNGSHFWLKFGIVKNKNEKPQINTDEHSYGSVFSVSLWQKFFTVPRVPNGEETCY
jgi:hypothetical protein